jgi:peptide/nickel transport system substrate-binding protein
LAAGRRPLVAAVGVLCLLAGCAGSSAGGAPPPARSTSTTVLAIDHDRAAPAAPIDGASAGGTVTVLSFYGPPTIDPTEAYYTESITILSALVTRSLTQYVYDPATRSMVLVPDLATDTGTPNADFTQWTFTIRAGVKYEDGSTVTADDVAYGIKRSFDRADFPSGPPFSNEYLLNGQTYQGPYRSGTEYPGVVVKGNTLTLKMARPFADMPYWASFPAIGPIPQNGSDPAVYARHPLATGPYKVAQFSPEKSLTLVRNPYWDPSSDPGRHAYPDRYVFDFRRDQTRIDATILGKSEVGQSALSFASLLPDDYGKAARLHRLSVGAGSCTDMWFPDYRKITDIRVRQAIGYAVPYKELAQLNGLTPGVTWLSGASVLPPGFPGRQHFNPLTTTPGHTDPNEARALLQQAGYAPGEFELRFLYQANDPSDVERKNLYTSALEAAGFKVTPYPTSSHEQYLKIRDDPNAPINLRMSGWCADWPSGNAVFPPLFGSKEAYGSHFGEPSVDRQIDQISRRPLNEQPEAWGALDRRIITDYYPVVVTGYPGVALPHGSHIGGMNEDNIYSMPTWKDLYVIR